MARLKFVSIDQLLEMQANNETFRLVEVLREEKFNQGHIPGAINIPADMLGQGAPGQLNKNDAIVVYCSSYACRASTNAARLLQGMGFGNVLDFKGGKKAWVDAGLELEK